MDRNTAITNTGIVGGWETINPVSVKFEKAAEWLKSHFESKSTTEEIQNDEIPTQYLLDSLKKSEADVKAGRVISFATGKDALDYLDKMITNDKRNK